jgi:hypothetical protein
MSIKLRMGAVALAVAALSSAQVTVAKPVARDENAVVAVVGDKKITKAQIVDEAVADQAARLRAGNPQARDLNQIGAAQIFILVDAGDLLTQRLKESHGAPVQISRADYINSVFDKNSSVAYDAVLNKIREYVIRQAAGKAGIKVTKADVDKPLKASLDGVLMQYPDLKGKPTAVTLAWFGFREDFVRRNITVQVMLDKLRRAALDKRLGHPVGPSDFIEARNILVSATPEMPKAATPDAKPEAPSKEATEKAFADAKVKIDEIAAELKAGNKRKFEEIAKITNTDATQMREGSLGVFMRGSMVPEFDKVAFSLKKGEVSAPVRTMFGWHIIRVDRVGSDISEPERDQKLKEYLTQRMPVNVFIDDLMKAAKWKNYLKEPARATPMGGMDPRQTPRRGVPAGPSR